MPAREHTETEAAARELTEPEAHAEHAEALAQTLFGRAGPSAAERVYRLDGGELLRVARAARDESAAG